MQKPLNHAAFKVHSFSVSQICNQQVVGSIPIASSTEKPPRDWVPRFFNFPKKAKVWGKWVQMVNTVPLENVSSYAVLAKEDTMSQVTILELLQWNKKGASSTNKNSSAPTLETQRPRRSGDAPSAINVVELL